MLCYVMLCYVMLCYVMLCYVTQESAIEAAIHARQAFMHKPAHATNVWTLCKGISCYHLGVKNRSLDETMKQKMASDGQDHWLIFMTHVAFLLFGPCD
jgi:hypothetical protein